jgi:hypothetical protein
VQIIQEYEEKIGNITKQYEEKLKLLEKESNKDTDSHLSTANHSYSKENSEF